MVIMASVDFNPREFLPMMGRDTPPQRSLFYTGINLDKRVRSDHLLGKVSRLVDFDFVYGAVQQSYGYNGHVSVAPPMILSSVQASGRTSVTNRFSEIRLRNRSLQEA